MKRSKEKGPLNNVSRNGQDSSKSREATGLREAGMKLGMPPHIQEYFSTRGSGLRLNPSVVMGLVGSDKIPLHKYDIWVLGKTKNGDSVYTKIRIVSKEDVKRGNLQGLIEVTFIAGYGYDILKSKGSDTHTVMRCANISKTLTEDKGYFKKRAVIDIDNKTAVSVHHADAFVRIPAMDYRLLEKFEKPCNTKKRHKYRELQCSNGSWPHKNRENVRKDNTMVLHKMLLPYRTNLDPHKYFGEFFKDILTACLDLGKNFSLSAEEKDSVEDTLEEVFYSTAYWDRKSTKKRSLPQDVFENAATSTTSTTSAAASAATPVAKKGRKKFKSSPVSPEISEGLKNIPATQFSL